MISVIWFLPGVTVFFVQDILNLNGHIWKKVQISFFFYFLLCIQDISSLKFHICFEQHEYSTVLQECPLVIFKATDTKISTSNYLQQYVCDRRDRYAFIKLALFSRINNISSHFTQFGPVFMVRVNNVSGSVEIKCNGVKCHRFCWKKASLTRIKLEFSIIFGRRYGILIF
jgi:hypothetical protein